MIERTAEQARSLEAEEKPAKVMNPATHETFFLIRQDVYELVCKIVEGPNKSGWDDPALDVYERFRLRPAMVRSALP